MLGHLAIQIRGSGLQSKHLAGPVGHNQQITSALPPDFAGTVLDRRHVARGHERADVRQIRQQFSGARESFLPLAFKGFLGFYGVAEVFLDSGAHALLHAVPDDQQRSCAQAGCDGDQR